MLQPFYYLVLEGFAFVVCFLIYLNLRTKKSPLIDEKVFLYLILANMFILCADIITWYCDGEVFPMARFILISSNVFYYLLSSIILFLWSLYVSLRIKNNHPKFRKYFIICASLPIIFEIVMSISAPINGLYFYVDSANVYHRGPWCWTQAVIGIIYMMYAATIAMIYSFRLKTANEKKEFFMLVVFTIFPLICSMVQSQFFGLPLIWLGTTISFLIFFIHTQNSQISLDALTKLSNRGKFDAYIRQKMQEIKDSEILFLMVIDIDSFKLINDSYGHIEGDHVLIDLADILKKVCIKSKDFAARYGGDEFALICIRPKKESDLLLTEELLQLISNYNKESNNPYSLQISFGTAAYTYKSTVTEDELKQQADKLMYEMKARHHIAHDRRKSNVGVTIA